MLSPRTAKYVEALIREGDDFDYRTWLRRVREEETKAKQVPATFSSGEIIAPEIGDLTNTPDRLDAWANSGSALQAIKSAPIPRPVYRSDHKARENGSKDRLRRRLIRVSDAFDEFQECRKRDAVYGYLKAVFALSWTTKGGDEPNGFCDVRSNSLVFHSTRTRILSPRLFAAQVNVT